MSAALKVRHVHDVFSGRIIRAATPDEAAKADLLARHGRVHTFEIQNDMGTKVRVYVA